MGECTNARVYARDFARARERLRETEWGGSHKEGRQVFKSLLVRNRLLLAQINQTVFAAQFMCLCCQMHVLSKNDVCVSEKIQVNFLKFDSFVGNQKFWEEFIEEPFLARVILHM